MVKHAVATLKGALLDAAVAKAEDLPVHPGRGDFVFATGFDHVWAHERQFSTDWAHGGPIIERERIELLQMHTLPEPALWMASPVISMQDGEISSDWHGPTPLIAAMRAYVASKFGDEVEL
jgi:hypothetical protein